MNCSANAVQFFGSLLFYFINRIMGAFTNVDVFDLQARIFK